MNPKRMAANLRKAFELTELTKRLNMSGDADSNPHLSRSELQKRFSRRMIYWKDLENRRCLKKY